jgi:hypothetical protein
MPENLTIMVTPPAFAEGYCPTSYQQVANDMAEGFGFYIAGIYTVWNYGQSEPAAADRGKPWLRLKGDGTPDKVYIYYNGQWVSRHQVPAGGQERRLWVGSTGDLETYDGGQAGAVGAASGPMWEVDSTFGGRMPLGVGTTPAGTAIAVATDYGNDEVTLAEVNLPEHYHYVARSTQQNSSSISGTQTMAYIGGGYGNENYVLQGLDVATNPANVGQTSTFGEASPTEVVTLNPARGVFFIKRTNRVFYIPE